MLRELCPKCSSKGLSYEEDGSSKYKVCINCGYTRTLTDQEAAYIKSQLSIRGALTIG